LKINESAQLNTHTPAAAKCQPPLKDSGKIVLIKTMRQETHVHVNKTNAIAIRRCILFNVIESDSANKIRHKDQRSIYRTSRDSLTADINDRDS
jgi:hypothetical protein